jgi:hypothetical protein
MTKQELAKELEALFWDYEIAKYPFPKEFVVAFKDWELGIRLAGAIEMDSLDYNDHLNGCDVAYYISEHGEVSQTPVSVHGADAQWTKLVIDEYGNVETETADCEEFYFKDYVNDWHIKGVIMDAPKEMEAA